MPYEIDPNNRKCVRKADSKKRVGCTKGSIKKYLGALHANVHESEENFDWAKEIVSGVDTHIVLINKKSPYRVRYGERVENKEKVTGLPEGSFLKITGHQDGISFDKQECKIVNNRSGSSIEYLLVFPEEMEGDEGNTHCGDLNDRKKDVCHCRGDEFGRCWWVVLSDMAQVLYYPNRRGFMNESEEDDLDWVDIGNELRGVHFVFNPPLNTTSDYRNFIKTLSELDPTLRWTGYLKGHGFLKDLLPHSIKHFTGDVDTIQPSNEHTDAFIDFDGVLAMMEPWNSEEGYKIVRRYNQVNGWDFIKKNINESESEDELEWAKQIVNQTPLEFKGKEYMIDVVGFNLKELTNLTNVIKPFINNAAFEDSFDGNDHLFGCILHRFKNKTLKSISIHCGTDEYDYEPQKGYLCCLPYSFEEEAEANKANIIPINGRLLLNQSDLNESEEFKDDDFGWAKDIINNNEIDITNNIDQLSNLPIDSKIIITGEWEGMEFNDENATIVSRNDRTGNVLLAFNKTLHGDGGSTHCGDFTDREKDVCHCRGCLKYEDDGRCWWTSLNDMDKVLWKPYGDTKIVVESEGDDFEWAKDIVKGVETEIKLDKFDSLENGMLLKVWGYQDGLELDGQECRLVKKNTTSENEYLVVFPTELETEDDYTHCGNNNSLCHCSDADADIGRCWWIKLADMSKVVHLPNRLGFITESEDDDLEWAKDIVDKIGNDYLKDNAWTLELPNGSYEEFEDAQKWAFEQGYKWRSTPDSLLPRKEYEYYKKIANLGSVFDTDIRQKVLTYSGNDFKLSNVVDIVERHSKNNVLFYLRWDGTKPKLVDVIPIVRDKKLRESEDEFEWAKDIDYSQYLKIGQVFKANRSGYFFEIINLSEGSIKCEGFSWKDPDDKKPHTIRYDTFLRLLNKKMWVPLDTPLNESEDDFDWTKDILSQNPLEFKDKEYFIDVRGLDKNELVELSEVLRPYLNKYSGGHGSSDQVLGCIVHKKNIKSVSLHCGNSDNDYEPLKGQLCCLNYTFEAEKRKENIIPINGKDLLKPKTNVNESLIIEGRYDSITRKVVKDIMDMVRNSNSKKDISLPNDIRDEEYQYINDNLAFSVELSISFENVKGFDVNASISNDRDEDIMLVNIKINPTLIPNIYEELFYKLQETIRHEIQHLTQYGVGKTVSIKTTFGHHKNKFEVPALVHGFYRRAKLEKRPLDDVMMDDLDLEIERGNLNKKQAKNLLKMWIDYAKQNLPSAIYSQE